MSDAVRHGATGAVVALVTTLLTHGAWRTTRQLADEVGIGPDTARRQLLELAAAGWVRMREADGTQAWELGPALPAIGTAWLSLLQQRRDVLVADLTATTRPYGWVLTPSGARWRPLSEVPDEG